MQIHNINTLDGRSVKEILDGMGTLGISKLVVKGEMQDGTTTGVFVFLKGSDTDIYLEALSQAEDQLDIGLDLADYDPQHLDDCGDGIPMHSLPRNETVQKIRERAAFLRSVTSANLSAPASEQESIANELEQKLKELRQLAHVAKNEFIKAPAGAKGKFVDDEDYRLFLQVATETKPGAHDGKRSTADMLTLAELERVMKAFRDRGFKVRYKKNPHPNPSPKGRGAKLPSPRGGGVWGEGLSRAIAQEPQDQKIRALWLAMHQQGIVQDPSEEALAAWIKREFKVEALQWLTSEQCASAIERLKKWQTRAWAQRHKKGAALDPVASAER